MIIETFAYQASNGGWSVEPSAQLDSPQTLVLVFGAPELQNQQAVFQTLRQRYKRSKIIGCSTAGEIFGADLRTGSLSVAVLRFERTELFTASVAVRDMAQSRAAASSVAEKLRVHGEPAAIVFLSDGVLLDQQSVVDGLVSSFGPNVPIVGTFAADGERFERPWVLTDDRLQSGLCVAVGLFGESVSLACATTDDWGSNPPREVVVTKSRENVVAEIDQRPALELCQTATGIRPLKLLGEGTQPHCTPLWTDEESQSVAFHRSLPEGSRVLLLDPDAESLIQGAAEVGRTLSDGAQENSVALALSSIGRRLFLGQRAADEVLAFATRLSATMPIIGLYGYGAIAPSDQSIGAATNSSLSIVVLGEKADGLADVTDAEALPAPEPRWGTGSHADSGSHSSAGSSTSGFSSVLSGVRPRVCSFGDLRATVYETRTLTAIVAAGVINESFDPTAMGEFITGRVVLDLAGVTQITSFGVRGWLQLFGNAQGLEKLFLSGCGEVVVNQMLMVRNFSGGGQIVSFGAPYICTACSNAFEFPLETEAVIQELEASGPPDVACSECGNRAVFDDDPESYFEFLQNQERTAVPDDVRSVLVERRMESLGTVEESVQKHVDGERTTFRINRALDEKIRWKRVLQGSEGIIRIDFSGSRDASPLGIERMLVGLRAYSDSVREIWLDQVHPAVIEQLVAGEAMEKLRVRSVAIAAACTNCGIVRNASVSPAQVRDVQRRGVQPETECRRCSASVPIGVPEVVSTYFLGGGKGASANAGSAGPLGIAPQWWALMAGLIVVFVAFVILLLR